MRRTWVSLGWSMLLGCSTPGSDEGPEEFGSETVVGESESSSSSSSAGDEIETDSSSSETESTTADSESESTDTSSSESESSESGSTETGDDLPDCEPLVHAPPATMIDGLPAVAIDMLAIDAQLEFDFATQQAVVDVTVDFQLGPEGGMPIFDLRQTIAEAELDGLPLDPQLLASHDFGKGIDFGFRILEQALEPCSVHALQLHYPLAIPNAPASGGYAWANGDRLYFDTWMSDLNPGRYLESWLPANLPFDRHALTIGVTLANLGSVPHRAISNAVFSEDEWVFEFPDTTTAMAPLLVIVPSDEVDTISGIHAAINGQDIPYSIFVHQSVATPIAAFETDLHGYLDAFVGSTGDFQHPAMTVYIGASLRSMEYDGALTTKPPDVEHETFHSWWARGVHPATYADGWIDEAWDMYNTTAGLSFTTEPFDWQAFPVQLFDPHPFARDTPDSAYVHGRRVFGGLAAILGVAELRMAMADLYVGLGPLGSITTAELERHLYCWGGESAEVRQAFWQFVYGQIGQAPALPMDACG